MRRVWAWVPLGPTVTGTGLAAYRSYDAPGPGCVRRDPLGLPLPGSGCTLQLALPADSVGVRPADVIRQTRVAQRPPEAVMSDLDRQDGLLPRRRARPQRYIIHRNGGSIQVGPTRSSVRPSSGGATRCVR
ncbi:hypothetical protein GCM10022207_64690 [Streptomyces lannensis]|uniref:Uncharacterized protein n=1 Tax=Streptomyces lannensis TaxID=766498 RepID=A0ABP7KUB8_9ACTN